MNTCRSCTKFFCKLVISFAESSCLTDIPKLPRSALLKKEFKFVLFYPNFADNYSETQKKSQNHVLLWSKFIRSIFVFVSRGLWCKWKIAILKTFFAEKDRSKLDDIWGENLTGRHWISSHNHHHFFRDGELKFSFGEFMSASSTFHHKVVSWSWSRIILQDSC